MSEALVDVEQPLTLWGAPSPIGIVTVDRRFANRLLATWDNPLGPCDRPFGQDQWALQVLGKTIGIAVTASQVSTTVKDENGVEWGRKQTAELARIATADGEKWATRPLLRFWRCVLVHQWEHWPVSLAISYALPGKRGDIYRFDGWTKVRKTKPSAGGGTWSKPPAVNNIDDGEKTLWVFHFDGPAGLRALGGGE